jgi:MFS family permease
VNKDMSEGKKARPWLSRNIISLGFVSLFTDISSEMIYPYIPVLIKSVGGGPALIGLIEGIAEATASILKAFSGWFSDKIQKRKSLILAGYSLSALSKPLLGLSRVWSTVLGFRFLDRVGKGIRTAPRDAILADSASEASMGRAFGLHRAMDTLGAVIGPLAGFFLLRYLYAGNEGAFCNLFFWAVIPAVLGLIVIIFWVKEIKPESRGAVFQFRFRDLHQNFYRYLIVSLFFVLGNFSNAFLILRAQELGVAIAYLTLIYLVYNVVYSATSYPAGVLSDKIGRRKTIALSYLIFALVYIGFAFASSPLHVWLLFAAYGIFDGINEGVQRAFVADIVPSEKRATAYGIYHAVTGSAMLPASLIAGLLWKAASASAAFIFGASLALIACLLLIILVQERNISPAQSVIINEDHQA